MKVFKIKLFPFFVILFCSFVNYSQPVAVWEDYYDAGGSYEFCDNMAVDGYGYVYVTGTSNAGSTNGDIITIKYRPDGTKEWVRQYDFTGHFDWGKFVTLDPSGFIYVTGKVGISSSNSDIAVIKYEPDGDMAWVKRFIPSGYSGLGLDEPRGAIYKNNYLYVTGSIVENSAAFHSQIAVFRIAANALYSSNVFGTTGMVDQPWDITCDDAANIYIAAGGGYVSDIRESRGYVLKYTSALGFKWVRVITDPDRTGSSSYRIKLNSSGRVIVSGASSSMPAPAIPVITFTQLNQADGSIIWYRTFSPDPATTSVGTTELAIDNLNNIVFGGYYNTSAMEPRKSLVLKYNSAGGFLWSTTASSIVTLRSLSLDASANIYITGNGPGAKCFAKINPSGILSWYGSVDSCIGYKILAVDPSSLYLCGSTGSTDHYNLFTAKYTVPTGSGKPLSETSKTAFMLYDNYPNPFNPATSIRYSVPVSGYVSLKVYDNIGREIDVLVNGNVDEGEHEVIFNAQHLASGLYFYKLSSGGITIVKKMILVK